jgi:putative ABC transport system permease protein
MDGFRQDLRYALRALTRSPGFAAIAILTLGLGIGATTSVFSVVRGLLLSPLPFRASGELVRFYGANKQFATGTISLAEYRDDYEALKNAKVAAWAWGSGSLASASGMPEHIGLGRASASLLPMLGVTPAYGRWFTREEEEPGRSNVVVLGRALWQRRFGGDPSAVGRTVEIMGRTFQIVGVLGEDLELPETFDAWRPLPFPPDQLTPQSRANHFLRVIGRTSDLSALRSELLVVAARARAQFPAIYPGQAGYEMAVVPLLDQMVSRVRPTLWMLFGAVLLVLLMACANAGNLLLARASSRERELAVRAAMGAGRARLVRQLLVESLVLALLGGALGFLIALWGVDLLLAAGPADLPRAREVRVDGVVLAFALGASLVSGVVFGLLPALTSTQSALHDVLRSGSASAAPKARRLRRALVVADVALAMVLACGAALLVRSFASVLRVEAGFQPEGAIALTTSVTGDEARQRAIFSAVLQRLRELPGAIAAGGVDYAPLSGVANDASFELEGHPVPAGAQPPDEEVRIVTPGFFEAMGIRIVDGAPPLETDAAPLAVVNQSFARKYWPQGAMSQRLRLDGDPRWWTVAGIAGDVHEFGLDAEAPPIIYLPINESPASTLTLFLRTKTSARDAARDALAAISAVDPRLAAYQVKPASAMLAASLAQRTFALQLLYAFAALALLLAGLGLYGVLAHAVAQRTKEIGVRMALGARPGQALALIARESAAVVGVGLLIGLAGALISARLGAGLLFGVGPADPLALVSALLVLGAVAAIATLLPARRAARIDPAVALREE